MPDVDANDGLVTMQVTDALGKPLRGFRFADFSPIDTHDLNARAIWKRPLSELGRKPVHLEFAPQHAALYSVDLAPKP